MNKLISTVAFALVASLGLAACGDSTPAKRVQVTVKEDPVITATRCFMRVAVGDEKPILVDFRKPATGTGPAMMSVRNFELCSQARAGDIMVLDAFRVE